MFLWCLTEDDDVIQISYGKGEVLEYTSHQFLEVCWCLSESEWDFDIFKFTKRLIKGCFRYRWCIQGDVVVSCVEIQGGEVCGSI